MITNKILPITAHKRLVWIDTARLIAMYCVILAHSHIADKTLFNFLHIFVLPLFFFLSGATDKPHKIKDEFIRSFRSVLVPYFWLYIVCYFWENAYKFTAWLVHNPVLFYENRVQFFREFMGLFLAGDTLISEVAIVPLWFLWTLFCCRIFFSIVNSIPLSKAQYYAGQVILCILYTTLALISNLRLPFEIRQAFVMYPFFFLGNVLVKNVNFLLEKRSAFAIIAKFFIMLLCIFTTIQVLKTNGYAPILGFKLGQYPLLCYVGALTGISMILIFSSLIKLPKWTNLFSYNTLIILGFHWSFLPQVGRIIEKVIKGFDRNNKTLFEGITVSLLVLLLCAIPIYIINRFFPFIIGKTCKASPKK